MINVELALTAPHYADVRERESGVWAESAPGASENNRASGNFHHPSWRGTVHVQTRCEVRPQKDSFTKEAVLSYSSPSLAWDVRSHARQGQRGFTLLHNGAASADR
jgi:hypothetical protein